MSDEQPHIPSLGVYGGPPDPPRREDSPALPAEQESIPPPPPRDPAYDSFTPAQPTPPPAIGNDAVAPPDDADGIPDYEPSGMNPVGAPEEQFTQKDDTFEEEEDDDALLGYDEEPPPGLAEPSDALFRRIAEEATEALHPASSFQHESNAPGVLTPEISDPEATPPAPTQEAMPPEPTQEATPQAPTEIPSAKAPEKRPAEPNPYDEQPTTKKRCIQMEPLSPTHLSRLPQLFSDPKFFPLWRATGAFAEESFGTDEDKYNPKNVAIVWDTIDPLMRKAFIATVSSWVADGKNYPPASGPAWIADTQNLWSAVAGRWSDEDACAQGRFPRVVAAYLWQVHQFNYRLGVVGASVQERANRESVSPVGLRSGVDTLLPASGIEDMMALEMWIQDGGAADGEPPVEHTLAWLRKAVLEREGDCEQWEKTYGDGNEEEAAVDGESALKQKAKIRTLAQISREYPECGKVLSAAHLGFAASQQAALQSERTYERARSNNEVLTREYINSDDEIMAFLAGAFKRYKYWYIWDLEVAWRKETCHEKETLFGGSVFLEAIRMVTRSVREGMAIWACCLRSEYEVWGKLEGIGPEDIVESEHKARLKEIAGQDPADPFEGTAQRRLLPEGRLLRKLKDLFNEKCHWRWEDLILATDQPEQWLCEVLFRVAIQLDKGEWSGQWMLKSRAEEYLRQPTEYADREKQEEVKHAKNENKVGEGNAPRQQEADINDGWDTEVDDFVAGLHQEALEEWIYGNENDRDIIEEARANGKHQEEQKTPEKKRKKTPEKKVKKTPEKKEKTPKEPEEPKPKVRSFPYSNEFLAFYFLMADLVNRGKRKSLSLVAKGSGRAVASRRRRSRRWVTLRCSFDSLLSWQAASKVIDVLNHSHHYPCHHGQGSPPFYTFSPSNAIHQCKCLYSPNNKAAAASTSPPIASSAAIASGLSNPSSVNLVICSSGKSWPAPVSTRSPTGAC